MGFFSSLGRGALGVATGGLSEFARSDPFGVPGAGQYMLPIAAAGAGAAVGSPGVGATVGGSIFSAMQGASAARDANAANAAIASGQMAFSADQAKRQMDFQERMSSTAHRREVEDLKAAGLNPLLSLNEGASSPAGSSGESAGYTSEVVPPVASRSLASAMESQRFMKEMKLLDKQTKVAEEQAFNTRESTERTFEDRRGLRLENDYMDQRNRFFSSNPTLFKWHLMSGGVNSASGALRLLK